MKSSMRTEEVTYCEIDVCKNFFFALYFSSKHLCEPDVTMNSIFIITVIYIYTIIVLLLLCMCTYIMIIITYVHYKNKNYECQ